MSSYIATELRKVIDVQPIVTVHYFEYAKNYVFEGERHDFWELLTWTRARWRSWPTRWATASSGAR